MRKLLTGKSRESKSLNVSPCADLVVLIGRSVVELAAGRRLPPEKLDTILRTQRSTHANKKETMPMMRCRIRVAIHSAAATFALFRILIMWRQEEYSQSLKYHLVLISMNYQNSEFSWNSFRILTKL